MANVDLEWDGVEKLREDLRNAPVALRYAAREGVNRSAFAARKIWQGEIRAKLVTRNKFTERSIQVKRASAKRNIAEIEAYVGSLADYMKTTELGGVVRGRGKTKPIPTSVAAGQGMGKRPRTRAVRMSNRLSAIALRRPTNRGKTRAQRTAIAISQAIRAGQSHVYLALPKVRGIFQIRERKRRRRGSGRKRQASIRLVWSFSKRRVRVPPHPTLRQTVDRMATVAPPLFKAALLEQLKRQRMLGVR